MLGEEARAYAASLARPSSWPPTTRRRRQGRAERPECFWSPSGSYEGHIGVHRSGRAQTSDYRAHQVDREAGSATSRSRRSPTGRPAGSSGQLARQLARKSKRQADYAWVVLARVLSGLDRGIGANPCEKGGRLYAGRAGTRCGAFDDEVRSCSRAPVHLYLPLLLGAWTGQREGDLLRLPWTAYDGMHIRLKQSKTQRRVIVPVGEPLKRALDAAKGARAPAVTYILVTSQGKPWHERMGSAPRGARPARRPAWSASRSTICAGRRSPDWRSVAWLHGARDRHLHRPHAQRRALDPRKPLPAPRPGHRRKRCGEAGQIGRNQNKTVKRAVK